MARKVSSSLILDDGTFIDGSQNIVTWVAENDPALS